MQELWTSPGWYVARPNRHTLFKLRGVGVTNIQYDWMHSKHLGTDKVVYASALHLLVFDIMGGADAADNMDVVWAAIDKWYKDNGVDRDIRFTKLRVWARFAMCGLL